MKMTAETAVKIDSMSYYDLLSHWRFAPPGDPWFEGETGKYWAKRMQEMKFTDPDPVGVSKAIGWGPEK